MLNQTRIHYSICLRFVLTFLFLSIVTLSIQAADGDLDTTFGASGIAFTDFNNDFDAGNAIATQSDGKLIVVGFAHNGSNRDFCIARYKVDGTLDTNFSIDGKVTIDFGNGNDEANAVAIQPDGRIIVAGYMTAAGNANFALARYKTDGSLDGSFGGGDGIFTDLDVGQNDVATGVVILSDGKILVSGYAMNGTNQDFALLKFNADGSLDGGFGGGDGVVTTDIGSSTTDLGQGLAVQSDGKIVVAGYSIGGINDLTVVVRYNADGTLDSAFDGDGKKTTAVGPGSKARAVAIQADGKIITAGNESIDCAVVRFNSDGALDNSFGSNGRVVTNIANGDECYGMSIQYDGKIVVVGSADNSGDVAIVKYKTDGSLDTSFDTDGKKRIAIGSGADIAKGVIVQADGKIVMAGTAFNGGSKDDFVVLRLGNTDLSYSKGELDFSFDGDGKRVEDLAADADHGRDVAIYPDGRIVVVGSAKFTSGADFIVFRYKTDGSRDFSLGDSTSDGVDNGPGVVSTDFLDFSQPDEAFAVALQPDGKMVVAGRGNSASGTDFALARYHENGSLDAAFDGDGKVLTNFGFPANDDQAYALAIQADGKIIAAGGAFETHPCGQAAKACGSMEFALARYDSDGSLDLLFGDSGIKTTHLSADVDVIKDIALTSDGKIWAVGTKRDDMANADIVLARYTSTGVLDTTFNNDGIYEIDVNSAENHGNAIALQSDGKPVVLGYTANGSGTLDLVLIRLDASGNPDSSFDSDGIVIQSLGLTNPSQASDKIDLLQDIAIQPNGKIVVVDEALGALGTDVFVFRFDPNGSLDKTFHDTSDDSVNNGDGKVVLTLGSGDDAGSAVALQQNGAIVLVGDVNPSNTSTDIFTARLAGALNSEGSGGGGGNPTVEFSTASQSGSEGAETLTVTLLLSAVTNQDVSVPFTLGGSATQGADDDYTIDASPVTIKSGEKSGTITITVNDDAVDEADETVVVTLGTPTNADLGAITEHTATIQDNDPPEVNLSFGGGEGSIQEAGGIQTVTATLSQPDGSDVTIGLVFGGTATLADDYTRTGTQIVITRGETTGNVTVTAVQDVLDENDETIVIDINSVTNGTEGQTSQVTTTITDDDPPPTVGFDIASQAGSESVSSVDLSVSLNTVSSLTITVDYRVTGGSATGNGDDYTLVNGTLTFDPGDITQIISFSVVDDVLDESNETLEITLENPVNSTLAANGVHTYTILDDDDVPAQNPTIKITANNRYVLFVNGKKIGEDTDFRSVETYEIPALKAGDIIAIQAIDTGWQGALAFQIDHPVEGKMVSNFTCHALATKSPPKGWNKSGFDASEWPGAFEHHTMDEQNIYGSFKEFDPSARWIWSRRSYHDNREFFVTKFDPTQNAMLSVTADDFFHLYLNGVPIVEGDNWPQVRFFPTTLKEADLIAIHAQRKGKVGGLLGWFKWRDDQDETHEFGTDETWSLGTVLENDWNTQGFDDSHWVGATSLGLRGIAPWKNKGTLLNVPKAAQWIWSKKKRNFAKDIWVLRTVSQEHQH